MAAVPTNATLINTLTSALNVVIDEDCDSRDSGISLTSCSSETDRAIVNPNIKNTIPNEKFATHRQALVDCSNLANKKIVNNSSRNSSFYHDTPTGRKSKSFFGHQDDSLDQSLYEKQILEAQLSEHRQNQRNRSESFELEESGSFTRKRSNSTTSSNASLRKRSRTLQIDPNMEVIDDDPFFKDLFEQETTYASPPNSLKDTLLQAKSLFNIDEGQSSSHALVVKRSSLDDSFNGLFNRPESGGNLPGKSLRTMSVGALNPDRPLPNVLEVTYRLPAVETPQKDSQAFRSISPLTLLKEFERLGDEFYSTYIIVDCRYPYEYQGGHIKGSLNVYCQKEIEKVFFTQDPNKPIEKRIPIFYCEFSQKRGPSMATKLRSLDRVRNELNYPHVEYPEIYLLDFGYRSLWNKEECRSICEPRDYVPMDKPEFVKQLRTFRGARLRSNASVKSCTDISITSKSEGSLRMSHRNLRKHSSFLSIRSNLSLSMANVSNEDVFDEPNVLNMTKRSSSAMNISSVGSEVDFDAIFDQVTKTEKSIEKNGDEIALKTLKKLENPFEEETEEVKTDFTVKLGLRIESPHFLEGVENVEGSTTADQPSPRTCLDFSTLSDTE